MPITLTKPRPSKTQRSIIASILAHSHPRVSIADLSRHRPPHHVSRWRDVVCHVMHRYHGVTQAELSAWFNVHPFTVGRGVRRVGEDKLTDTLDGKVLRRIIAKTQAP